MVKHPLCSSLGVPNRLVVYANKDHGLYKLEDRIDVTWRMLQWFEQYMGSKWPAGPRRQPRQEDGRSPDLSSSLC